MPHRNSAGALNGRSSGEQSHSAEGVQEPDHQHRGAISSRWWAAQRRGRSRHKDETLGNV
jgi:hypothetical protein